VRAVKDIAPFEVIGSVPLESAISAFKALSNPKCRSIIQQHPEVFVDVSVEGGSDVNDFLTLVLYVSMERLDPHS
jgi:hypothetical protein